MGSQPQPALSQAAGRSPLIQENRNIGSSMFWGAITIAKDGSVMVPTDQGLAIRSATGWTMVDRRRVCAAP